MEPLAVDYVSRAHEFCERNEICEVPICGMENMPLVLRGVDGNRYAEVDGNIWMAIGGDRRVAYVGTSRHGGHMTLRPLLVKLDGAWRNVITGKPRVLSDEMVLQHEGAGKR